MKTFRFVSALFVLSLVALSLSPAVAQDRYEEQVLAQLEEASEVFIDQGYEGVLGDGGALDHQTYQDYTVSLLTGLQYAIVGVCDEDCLDIDLEIYDGYDELVVADESDDDYPVVRFTVTQGGDFTLRVTMFECNENPCYYGVGLYGR